MAETVSNIKKHSCPSCGGPLRVNLDGQMYECPFCGVTYDYEYFREDDVLSRASQFLQRSEWTAAADAYDFLLSKDPHNFEALLGKILVAAHMKRQEDMSNLELFRSINFAKVKKCTAQAVRDTDSAHKEYFEKVQELFACAEEYDARKDTVEQSHQRRVIENRKLNAKKEERDMPIGLMLLIGIPLASFAMYFLLGYFIEKSSAEEYYSTMYQSIYIKKVGDTDIMLALFFVLITLLIVVVTYGLIQYLRVKKATNKEVESIEEELDSLGGDLKSGIDGAEAMQKRIRELYYEIRKLK